MYDSTVYPMDLRHVSASFSKGCFAVLDISDLCKYLPTDVLREGFRRGKSIKRGEAMRKRMESKEE